MTPSPWIVRFASLIDPQGLVLDLACGAGRHGRLFLERGHKVTFVDKNIDGLDDLQRVDQARIVQMDLEDGKDWPFEKGHYDAIVVTNYLYRPHLKALLGSIKEGGFLLYETFAMGNEAFGRPSNPDFLLKSNELLDLVSDNFSVIAFEQGQDGDKVVQRICCVKGTGAVPHLLNL